MRTWLCLLLALAACANPTPEEQACHEAYSRERSVEVVEHQETWVACLPDGGFVGCRSRLGVEPKDDLFPETRPNQTCLSVGENCARNVCSGAGK